MIINLMWFWERRETPERDWQNVPRQYCSLTQPLSLLSSGEQSVQPASPSEWVSEEPACCCHHQAHCHLQSPQSTLAQVYIRTRLHQTSWACWKLKLLIKCPGFSWVKVKVRAPQERVQVISSQLPTAPLQAGVVRQPTYILAPPVSWWSSSHRVSYKWSNLPTITPFNTEWRGSVTRCAVWVFGQFSRHFCFTAARSIATLLIWKLPATIMRQTQFLMFSGPSWKYAL